MPMLAGADAGGPDGAASPAGEVDREGIIRPGIRLPAKGNAVLILSRYFWSISRYLYRQTERLADNSAELKFR